MRLRGDVERFERFCGALRFGGVDLVRRDAEVSAVSIGLVEFRRLSSISAASPRARTSAMMARDAGDIFLGFALGVEQRGESVREIRRARIKTARHAQSLVVPGRPLRRPWRRSRSVRPASMHSTSSRMAPPPANTSSIMPPGLRRPCGVNLIASSDTTASGFAALDVVRLTDSTPSKCSRNARADSPLPFGVFPFEAVEQRREAPLLRQPDEILHLRDRILQPRRHDFEILRVLGRERQAWCHADQPFDLGADAGELFFQPLEAAIQMIDAIDDRFAFRRQPGQHEADGGAQIGGHHRRAFQSSAPRHGGDVAFDPDIGAHAQEFRDMHEAVLEDRFLDMGSAVGRRHQRHELCLQIGGKSGNGAVVDIHRDRPHTVAVHSEAAIGLGDFGADLFAADRQHRADQFAAGADEFDLAAGDRAAIA